MEEKPTAAFPIRPNHGGGAVDGCGRWEALHESDNAERSPILHNEHVSLSKHNLRGFLVPLLRDEVHVLEVDVISLEVWGGKKDVSGIYVLLRFQSFPAEPRLHFGEGAKPFRVPGRR